MLRQVLWTCGAWKRVGQNCSLHRLHGLRLSHGSGFKGLRIDMDLPCVGSPRLTRSSRSCVKATVARDLQRLMQATGCLHSLHGLHRLQTRHGDEGKHGPTKSVSTTRHEFNLELYIFEQTTCNMRSLNGKLIRCCHALLGTSLAASSFPSTEN